MSDKIQKTTRRGFLKTVAAAGIGTVAAGAGMTADGAQGPSRYTAEQTRVPTRPFGKTGVEVSILSLGGMFDIISSQLILSQALKWGVTYWDTAYVYSGGRSEEGIGKFFRRYPQERANVFLVSKSDDWDPDGMSQRLEASLKRLNTAYVDLYFVHGIHDIDVMDDGLRRWGQKAKADGKIRFFGFSTHDNMEACLLGASDLGWIDGIMMTYNYRLMYTTRMQAAVKACAKAGIGLTAMKTQASSVYYEAGAESKTAVKLTERFIRQGFTAEQARLKAVWDNPYIASICSLMPNMTYLKANVAAAMNRVRLSATDKDLLRRHACETRHEYCAGCTNICESTLTFQVPIGDVMRHMMYARSYGDRDRARTFYQSLPETTRRQMRQVDYREAERKCPQGLPIGRLMKAAKLEFNI